MIWSKFSNFHIFTWRFFEKAKFLLPLRAAWVTWYKGIILKDPNETFQIINSALCKLDNSLSNPGLTNWNPDNCLGKGGMLEPVLSLHHIRAVIQYHPCAELGRIGIWSEMGSLGQNTQRRTNTHTQEGLDWILG